MFASTLISILVFVLVATNPLKVQEKNSIVLSLRSNTEYILSINSFCVWESNSQDWWDCNCTSANQVFVKRHVSSEVETECCNVHLRRNLACMWSHVCQKQKKTDDRRKGMLKLHNSQTPQCYWSNNCSNTAHLWESSRQSVKQECWDFCGNACKLLHIYLDNALFAYSVTL